MPSKREYSLKPIDSFPMKKLSDIEKLGVSRTTPGMKVHPLE